MPGRLLILNYIGILLQYGLLVLLYYFLYKVLRMVVEDLYGYRFNQNPGNNVPVKPSPETARLSVLETGPVNMAKSQYTLGETVSIGRHEGNDIIINDSFISHEHACISRYNHGFWLTDLHSTNGTYLNNQLVKEEVKLKNGDIITIGAVTFRFER